MPLVLANRVRETTTTTGTGAVSLGGAVSGFQGFNTAIGNANTTYYTIVDAATSAWEVGLGTYTAAGSTLSRDTVFASSSGGALVPFAAGVKDVFVTQPSERAVYVLGASTGLAAGAAAFTANGVPYANSTSTLATSANMTFNGTRLTVADLADSGLTSGRVVYASTGGSLVDSANLTFDGTSLTLGGNPTLSGGTANGVAYLNGSKVLTTGSALVFDGTNLGIGTSSPSSFTGYTTVSVNNATNGGIYNILVNGTETARLQAYSGIFNVAAKGAATNLTFETNGSERMRLDTAGNRGLGVTPGTWAAAAKALDFTFPAFGQDAAGAAFMSFNARESSSGNWVYKTTDQASRLVGQTDGSFQFFTAPSGTAGNAITFTQAMTLTAAGNLGVGTTSPQRLLHLNGTVGSMRLEGSSVGGYIEIIGPSNTNYIGTPAAITSGSTTDLAFFLSAAERARITSGGAFLVGTTTTLSTGGVTGFLTASTSAAATWPGYFENTNASPFGVGIRYATDSNAAGNDFLYCVGNTTLRASIRSNGGVANYSGNNVNISDRREKTDFAPAGEYLSKICAIPVQTFKYIDQSEDDPGLTLGVVAQDVQAVAPELVMESNWGSEDEPKMRLSIYQTDLQYALMKCIQEQQALITSLTARIAALEA